jgi:transcriptional regulator with XRE-family HTH domain
MLSERIRVLLTQENLTHGDFAAKIGIKLERVRNLLQGRAAKLRPDEVKAIRDVFGVRELWLLEGKGPMKLTEDELLISPALDALEKATNVVKGLKLQADVIQPLHELLFACFRGNSEAVTAAIAKFSGHPSPQEQCILLRQTFELVSLVAGSSEIKLTPALQAEVVLAVFETYAQSGSLGTHVAVPVVTYLLKQSVVEGDAEPKRSTSRKTV